MEFTPSSRSAAGWLTAAYVVLWTAASGAQTGPYTPGTPAASVAGSLITLTWAAPLAGSTGYTIVVRQTPGGPIIASLPVGNVTTVSGTAPDGTYFLTVLSTNAGSAGPESAGVSVTVAASRPGPPTNLAVTVSGTTASFTWNAPALGGAPTGYSLVASLTPGGASIATLPVGNRLTHSVSSVPPGTYFVTVSATNASGASTGSNEVGVFVSAEPTPTLSGPTNVTVTSVNTQVVGVTTLSSSSRLKVSWTAPTGYLVDHYEIRAVEFGAPTDVTAPASQTSVTLTGLKASTAYSVTVKSCRDSSCVQNGVASAVTGATSPEYWQVQGTGGSASTATVVVVPENSAGSVMAWPILYGAEAGSSLQGKVRLYFRVGPNGLSVGVALSGTATAAPASVSSFAHDPSYGLRNPSPGTTFINADFSAAPQGVPRSVGGTRKIGLFFKGPGADNKSRVFYLDSQDGLTGQDFHPGSSTLVSDTADWEVGGAAAPTIIIGVTGDQTFGDSGLNQARQFKIGVPLLTNWLWDEAPGTFMVVGGEDDCGQTVGGLFYAQYDGRRWTVVKDVNKCARPLAVYAHGPIVVHRGGTRYKLYYEDRLVNGGDVNKPTRMIYGDGAFSGPSSLEFEDWESPSMAREVHFLWPNGSLVSVGDESGFGDHAIFYPTGDPDVQVMYMNLTGTDGTPPVASRGIGMAVLINP